MSKRWAWAEVDLEALRNNLAIVVQRAGLSQIWATVKANAYGHGLIEIAEAVVVAGANGLCVALADEALQLRRSGISCPILVLSEQPDTEHEQMLLNDVSATLYNESTISKYLGLAERLKTRARVHLKVDTGMHRVGAPIESAMARVQQLVASKSAIFEGAFTHFAMADLPRYELSNVQVSKFYKFVADLETNGLRPQFVHTSNSAAVLRNLDPASEIFRLGIAMYGIAPSVELESVMQGFKPVLSLRARVVNVQRVHPGQGVSYGWQDILTQETTIATLPLGYADGIFHGYYKVPGKVLIRGQAFPIVGAITMDQMMINCGGLDIEIGEEAVLIGRQGELEITANQVAKQLDTIGYEIVCSLSTRIPRKYLSK